jgi:proline dehydrogenase
VALLDRAIVRLLPAVPKPVVQRLSSRYIAGPRLDDAVRVVGDLNDRGKMATIDVLGEDVTNPADARSIAQAYLDVFEEIDRRKLDSNVSVKLTGLGLKLDYDLCRANLETVVRDARGRGNFVRIDMEDSTTTDDTLALYRELRDAGYENVGLVLQSSLRRTVQDVRDLADLKPSVRITKGIYIEPPGIQYRDYDAVRASFLRALELLLEIGAYPAIATHDEWLIEESLRRLRDARLERHQYEFQMLLGVRPERADSLVRDGHRLRVYVPFGSHWYAYSLRRLQENPKLAGYIAVDTFNRLIPGRTAA